MEAHANHDPNKKKGEIRLKIVRVIQPVQILNRDTFILLST